MIHKFEESKTNWEGKHQAIDAFLQERQELLLAYVQLAGLTPKRHSTKTLPTQQQLQHFCEVMVDYLSAGHFEIYQTVLEAFEAADGEQLLKVQKIQQRLRACIDAALRFNDRFGGEEISDDDLSQIDIALNELGPILEERFLQEDELLRELHILERLTKETASV